MAAEGERTPVTPLRTLHADADGTGAGSDASGPRSLGSARRQGVTPKVRLPRRHDLTVMELFAVEVRSALAGALASVDALRRPEMELTEEQRERLLGATERRLHHIEEVLDDVVDLDRLDRPPSEAWADIDLTQLVYRVAAEEASGESLRITADPAVVRGDEMLLRRAIGNLVRNAIVHPPRGCDVGIQLEAAGDTVRLIVEDDGPGVAERDRERIFEPFDRGGASPLTPGLGLGLAVVRRIASLHGGTVRAEASTSGGARFVLELPARAEQRRGPSLVIDVRR
jgi:two-component system, OmpR family, sensor histidine kinase KdpD